MAQVLIGLFLVGAVYGLVVLCMLAADRWISAAASGPERPQPTRGRAAHHGRLPEAVLADRRLAARENDAVHRLFTGELDRAGYQSTMAAIAAQDSVKYPLGVPRTPK